MSLGHIWKDLLTLASPGQAIPELLSMTRHSSIYHCSSGVIRGSGRILSPLCFCDIPQTPPFYHLNAVNGAALSIQTSESKERASKMSMEWESAVLHQSAAPSNTASRWQKQFVPFFKPWRHKRQYHSIKALHVPTSTLSSRPRIATRLHGSAFWWKAWIDLLHKTCSQKCFSSLWVWGRGGVALSIMKVTPPVTPKGSIVTNPCCPFKKPPFSTGRDGHNNSLKDLAIMGLAFAMVIYTEVEVSHLHWYFMLSGIGSCTSWVLQDQCGSGIAGEQWAKFRG